MNQLIHLNESPLLSLLNVQLNVLPRTSDMEDSRTEPLSILTVEIGRVTEHQEVHYWIVHL